MEDHYKSRRVIAEGRITSVFDDACIRRLAAIARLPQAGNMDCFAAGIRQAALLYARDAQEPSLNELHNEIRRLHEAAQRGEYDQAAGLIETLTPPARDLLVERGQGPQHVVSLPTPAMLRDPAQRVEASQTVAMLCRLGGGYVEGRRRASGRRSWSWRPTLIGPKPRRHIRKRQAERDFVMWLQVAWLDATGQKPSLTAHIFRPGPFAKMVTECLRLVGAPHADAIGLLNELARRRGYAARLARERDRRLSAINS